MTAPCTHPRTGSVTSLPLGATDSPHAAAPVCSDAACIAEARDWVESKTGEPARYVPGRSR